MFSKWMNSRRSFDNGLIGILGHDQFEQDLQPFGAGEVTIVRVIRCFSSFGNMKFSNNLLHTIRTKQLKRV